MGHFSLQKLLRTYIRHNRFTIVTLDIAKRHLCAFILVELEFGKVQVRDVTKSNYDLLDVRGDVASCGARSLLSWTTILVTLTAVSVVICLGPRRRPSNPFFRSSEVRSGSSCQYCNELHGIHGTEYQPLGGSSPVIRS